VLGHAARTAFLAAAIVATFATSAESAPPPSVIRVISITTSRSSIDVPPRNESAGDLDRSTSRLLNERAQFGKPKGAVIGSDRGTMTLTGPRSARLKVVATLPGGTITVNGALTAAGGGAVSIPVVTGTGVFAGARGTVTILKPINPKTVVNIYRLVYAPVA
jgi:hypothetical protein